MLNIYYILSNTIDLLKKKDKIEVSQNRKIKITIGVGMRVISGSARGTNLYSLEGDTTRPTLDRVKESLFNIIQNKIADANILDLFAGSGALGIEALSRGAKKAVFCDQSKNAIQIIKQNIEKTHLQEKAEIIHADYKKVLNQMSQKEKFDLILIDPPYAKNIAVQAVEEIVKLDLLAEDGIIILETDDKEREKCQLENIEINMYDIRKYGRIELIFLSRKG